MCGRFVLFDPKKDSLEILGKEIVLNLNACPGEFLPIIRINPKYHDKEVVMAQWGKFNNDETKLYNNIRKDYLTPRNRFWQYKDQHCLVPAGGFYEWDQNVPKGVKKPAYLVQTVPNEMFYMAGLWWEFEDGEDLITGFTIFTSEPHFILADIHHRSPVILNEIEQEEWLTYPYEKSEHLIKTYEGELEKYMVDNRVMNNARNKGADCIIPYDESKLL